MKFLFAGFRHPHIYTLLNIAAKTENVTVSACYEADVSARREAEQKTGIAFADADYEQLLSGDIDAVAIGARYGDRGGMIVRALKRGKHILTDKPICTSISQLDEIEGLAREKGLTVGCMFDLRYLPSVVAAEKILQSGKLGEVRNVSFTGQHCLDYKNRPSWYFEKDMHGGTINDLAVHGIDLLNRLAGLGINEVAAAKFWNAYAYRNKDFKDCALFMARLTNGAQLVFYGNNNYGCDEPVEIRLLCEKGKVKISYEEALISFDDGTSIRAVQGDNGIKYAHRKDYWGISHYGQIKDFYESIAERRESAMPAENALNIQRLIDGIYEASKFRPVSFGNAGKVNSDRG